MSGDEYTAVVEDVVLHFYRLPHESQHYTIDVPHYGLTITHGTEAILLPGDCAVASPALLPLIARQHFRLALLNFRGSPCGRAGNLSSSIYSLTISSSTIFRLRRTTRSISALQRCPKRSGCGAAAHIFWTISCKRPRFREARSCAAAACYTGYA